MTDLSTDFLLLEGAVGTIGYLFFFWLVAFSPVMRVPFDEARANFPRWLKGEDRYALERPRRPSRPSPP